MWKKLLLWPGISFSLVLLYWLYELIYPCNSGLFIGSCGMGRMMLYLFVFETWGVYLVVASVFVYIERKKHKSFPLWMYGGIGSIGTILLLYATLQGGLNSFILLYFFGRVMEMLRIIGHPR